VTAEDSPTVGLTAAAITGLIDSVPSHPVALTAAEITGLIGLFQGMLDKTERVILDRLADNARGATDRWTKHDAEQTEATRQIAARFEAVETSVREHHQREHERQLVADARIKPLRGSIAWIWTQRRDIVIVMIGIGVLATFLAETFGRIFGPHTP
jgi:hypothetical protein